MREAVLNERICMQSHKSYFQAFNVFYYICTIKIVPMLQTLSIETYEKDFYCKMIENTMPTYFIPIFNVNTQNNQQIIVDMIKEFFRAFSTMNFNLDSIKVSKLYQKNVSVLYSLRHLFLFEPGFYENILSSYLPEDSSLVTEDKFNDSINKFIDLIVFKFLEKTKKFLVVDNRLFLFTFFQLFQDPFEIIQFFLNDLSYAAKMFNMKYRERRLYLLDNLDNLALKSLSIFKSDRTHDLLKKLAINAHDQKMVNPDYENLDQDTITSYKDLSEFLNTDPYAPEDKETQSVTNYKLINACVKYSAFKSQSFEKMYCYYITLDLPESKFIIQNEKYNFKLGEIIKNNSEHYCEDFIKLKPSYFTEESEFNEKLYPKFKIAMQKAAVAFKKEYNSLIEKFYDDHFYSLRDNFEYYWRKITTNFLSSTVFTPGVSNEELYTNLLNFFDFVEENWEKKEEVDYFPQDVLIEKFVTMYHKNIETFTQYK